MQFLSYGDPGRKLQGKSESFKYRGTEIRRREESEIVVNWMDLDGESEWISLKNSSEDEVEQI